jgi:hypothetical protein
MSDNRTKSVVTLVRRELLEFRTSLCWTPLVILLAITAAMLVAVSLADQLETVRKAVVELVPQPGEAGSRISIRIDGQAGSDPGIEYRVEKPFSPGADSAASGGGIPSLEVTRTDELNPALQWVHKLFLFVLILVCANYLLGALYGDRRDRSILFWKSMPVSETRDVLSRYAVALLVAPALYTLASLLAQGICLGLGMVLVWRMALDPMAMVWHRVDLLQLLLNHGAGYLLMTLWLAPTYAWLLLASAAATRSPFMLALTPVLGLLMGERILLGSDRLAMALARHVPHLGGSPYAGFHWQGMADLPAIMMGLVFAALAVTGAVYLRRYYFEL